MIVRGVLADQDFLPLEKDYSDLMDAFADDLVKRGVISFGFAELGFDRRLAAIAENLNDVQWEKELVPLVDSLDCMHARTKGFYNFMFLINAWLKWYPPLWIRLLKMA